MRTACGAPTLLLAAGLLAAAGATPGAAGEQGAIAGAFTVRNSLPEGATLEAVVLKSGSSRPVATRALELAGSELPYRFEGLAAGTYKVRLVATREGKAMPLGETGDVELTAAAMSRDRVTAQAIQADAKLSGTVKVAGAFPAKRMVFVSARRSDMTHKSPMPDELNSMSYELNADDIQGGVAPYRFENLSYGVYRVQLIGYDFQTHKTETYGELAGEVVLDLDHRETAGRDFAADFGKAPAGP